MQSLIYIIAGVVLGAVVVWLFLRASKKEGGQDNSGGALLMMQKQLEEIRGTLDNKLGESARSSQYQHSESVKIIREITEKLTKLDETNKQVINFTDQLKDLQDILKNPKQRGILGEYYLETLLKNVLPTGSYQMQYTFPDGNIVDAVVFVKDKIIPIDSKFSLENYNRLAEEKNEAERERLEKVFVNDLKNRIVETSKYIQPENGTMDFAFMFIPHEAIYYDLIVNKIGALREEDTENLIQRAASKYKVIIVSPTSFLAYLQTVLQGLKALKIEESAKDIIRRVGELSKHWAAYEDHMTKLKGNLGTTVNTFNTAYKELGKIDKDVMRITDSSMGIEVKTLDKPEEIG